MEYLKLIWNARSLDKIATYMLALAAQHAVSGSHLYTLPDVVSELTKQVENAATIRRCNNLKEARAFLKQWGYFG